MNHPLVNIAVQAARKAGQYIMRAQENLANITVMEKGPNDFVSEVDQNAEQIIIDTVRKAYPDHGFFGEETGKNISDTSNPIWIIDPLDGTTNFLHNFPHFCVSIGIQIEGKLMHGVVFDPVRNELFTASKGKGAQCNERRIRVSSVAHLNKALLGTGFPYNDFEGLDQYMELMKTLMPNCVGIRRAGSAALDLAYVAAGRLDGFWEFGLKPWDIAAGALLISEAGGFVSDDKSKDQFMQSGNIVAANPKVHLQLIKKLAELKR
jgi:myo-inositol-1(or 4)-monophosphatase